MSKRILTVLSDATSPKPTPVTVASSCTTAPSTLDSRRTHRGSRTLEP